MFAIQNFRLIRLEGNLLGTRLLNFKELTQFQFPLHGNTKLSRLSSKTSRSKHHMIWIMNHKHTQLFSMFLLEKMMNEYEDVETWVRWVHTWLTVGAERWRYDGLHYLQGLVSPARHKHSQVWGDIGNRTQSVYSYLVIQQTEHLQANNLTGTNTARFGEM